MALEAVNNRRSTLAAQRGKPMYNTILVPIDLSHPERAVPMFEQAKAMLSAGGKMVAAHIVPAIPAYVASELPEEHEARTIGNARKTMIDMAKDAGVDAEIVVDSGNAATACLRVAERCGADLIVVASHNPNLSDYFLGSTAARIVRHAACSVLVMR
jgi:nucleotide-binding universal stress UspA family protein